MKIHGDIKCDICGDAGFIFDETYGKVNCQACEKGNNVLERMFQTHDYLKTKTPHNTLQDWYEKEKRLFRSGKNRVVLEAFISVMEHGGSWIIHSKSKGKKSIALTVLYRNLIALQKNACIVSARKILDSVKATFSDENTSADQVKDHYKIFECLLIDDLRFDASNAEVEIMYDILIARFNTGLSTIISTEINPKSIEDHWGYEIHDILENYEWVIMLEKSRG